MPTVQDTAIFKDLKNGTLPNICFFYGEEGYFIGKAEKLLSERAVEPQFASFNSITFSSDNTDINAVEDAVEGLPMMAERKYILLKDWDMEKLAKADFDRLCNLLDYVPDTVVLAIIIQKSPDVKKASRSKKLIDIISKNGIVCEFAAKDKSTLKRALCERAQKEYVNLEMDIAERMIDRCGTDYGRLVNELDKLISYTVATSEVKRDITAAAVDLCCIPSIEATSFELAKLLLSKRFDEGYSKLCDLLYLRQDGVAIVSALGMAFSDLYRASCAVEAGASQEQVLEDFGYPKNRAFAVKNAFRDIRSIPPQRISGCINALYEADLLLKSSKMEDKLILEQMLLKMKI